MSQLKRKHHEKEEASEAKKSRNDNEGEEQQILEHNQLRDLVDRTVLAILGEARGPMHRGEIKEQVAAKLQGFRIRHLGHLASGSWYHLVQGTLHNGLTRNWFEKVDCDDACRKRYHTTCDNAYRNKYQITNFGRDKIENGLLEESCSRKSKDVMTNPRRSEDSYKDSREHSRHSLEHSRSKALGTPELLSHIFSYLDYDDLQMCRDVSQHWRDVVLRYYFNDNLGNSPRIVARAVSENSTNLAMKTLRFRFDPSGGIVMDVQRDGERTFVTVKYRKDQSAAVNVYEGPNLKKRITMNLPGGDAKEFYTMMGTKTVAVVSSSGKGSLNVRCLDRFSLEEERIFGARMHLLNFFFPERDEMWFVKEEALVSKRRLVLIGIPAKKSGAIRRESIDIGKIIPRDDSMFSADFDDIVLDRQYDLRMTRSGRVILLLLPPLKKAILIKTAPDGDKAVHELPIQGSDSIETILA